MDEPFGALDPLTRDALGEDYRRLHDELGLTTVMITHDMLEAVLLADRIAVMRGGRIVADGTPHELMNGEQDDYVRELMETPRRQAERLRDCSERRAMNAAASPTRSRGCRTISAAMSRSASPRCCSALRSACRWRSSPMRRPALRSVLLGVASVVQTIPSLALLALFYPLLLGLAALTRAHVRRELFRARLPAVGAGADALFDAAGAAKHHHRPRRRRSRRQARPRSASA